MSHLDGVRDMVSVASTCTTMDSLIWNKDWPSIQILRLRQAVPIETPLCWILKRCKYLHEVDASGCGQVSDNLLFALSVLPIKVRLPQQ